MSTNGYRVYLLQLFDGKKQKPLDFAGLKVTDQAATPTAAEYFADKTHELYENLYAKVPSRLPTLPRDNAKPLHLQFETPPSTSSDRVEGSFYFGREGSHPALSRGPRNGQSASRVPMEGQAPVRPYNVLLHLPPQGNVGIMVGEQIGASCGAAHLIDVLNTVANNDRFHVRGTGERQNDGWLRVKATPVVDDQRIDHFIDSMVDAKLTLKRSGRNADGGPRSGDITIQQDLSVLPISDVRGLVRRWVDAFRGTSTKDELRSMGASAAGEFFEQVVQDPSEFEDAELSAKEHGKPQTVRPESLDRLFIYPTEGPLDRLALRRESAVTVDRIVTQVGQDSRYRIEPSTLRLK